MTKSDVLRVLHLSDLHFGSGHFFPSTSADPDAVDLAESVVRALEGLRVDVIVLSGDLLTRCDPAGLIEAEKVIHRLRSKLSPHSLLCVPGNHDVSWDKASMNVKLELYDKLVKDIGADDCLSTNLPNVVSVPCGVDGSERVDFALLDSCRLEGRDTAGLGRVGERQLNELQDKLRNQPVTYFDACENSSILHVRDKVDAESNSSQCVTRAVIAIAHHHLLPVHSICPRVQEGDTISASLTIDAPDVLAELTKCGVSAVFHGHQHHPAILKYQELNRADSRDIYLLAAGSVGASPPEVTDRHFFLHEIRESTLTSSSFYTDQNGSRFLKRHLPRHMPLYRPSFGCGSVCENDVSARVIPGMPLISGDRDTSDLYYLLFNVRNCVTSRTVLRQEILRIKKSDLWRQYKPQYLNLDGMYDLMGRWDLLVRLRYAARAGDSTSEISPFVNQLKNSLAMSNEIAGAQNELNARQFGLRETIDVLTEQTASSKGQHRPHRMALKKADYDSYRCQRAFIFVEIQDDEDKEEMKRAIDDMFKRSPEACSIIESLATSEEFIVLETFMRCSQSKLINKLNQALEEWIPRFTTQKHTLFCYEYDEEFTEHY